jgi:septal ring factor EnvC (AmiA/AmiB activator)
LTQTQKELISAKQKIRELEQEKTQALANVENFNQQLDDAQQELVRTQREKRKLAQKYQQEQDQHAKAQTQLKEQTSYLQSILGYLVKVGIATSS